EYFIREDVVLSRDAAGGVLSNDSASDGSSLTATIVTPPANGTIDLNADGSFNYTPNPDFNGNDSFGYIASAGPASSAEQVVTILVQAVNDAPIGLADSFQVVENRPLIINVSTLVANDSDVEGDAIMVTNVTEPMHGLMLFDEGDNAYNYQPFSSYTGEDSFTYIPNDVFTADDEPDRDRAVTVTITVVSANGGNVTTTADSYSVAEDTVLNESETTGVLANDSGGQLTSVVATQPANGTLTLQADGSFTYTPNVDYFGSDSFTYTATDGSETSAATTVQIQVEPVNDRPTASPESYTVGIDTPLSVNTVDGILANDVDVDGDSITALLIDDVSNGTLTLNEDGSFDYTPSSGFSGEETFTYIATDQTRDSSVTTVTITVGTTEYVAVDNLYELREDGELNIPVRFGVLVMDLNSPVGNTVAVETEPSSGTLTLNPDGSFVYMPQQDFVGDDTFTYTASAGGDNATATVTIRVSNREDAPIANDDSYIVESGKVLTTDALNGVLTNDTDADGDSLTAQKQTDPASGTLVFNSDGTFAYTPEADFTGTVTFTYAARDDGSLVSESATVSIDVVAAPVAAAARPDDSGSETNGTDLVDAAFADDDGLSGSIL
ncbi:Ig-like domain-containing protein, partial [Planctomycetota bacterium]